MNYRKLASTILIMIPIYLQAQPKDFCGGIDLLVKDAPTGFKSAKDTITRINPSGIVWASKVAVPGVIKGRIISAMGLRYEGALYQTKDTAALKAAYEQYKIQLNDCLSGLGYEQSTGDNFYPGMAAFKKLVYIKKSSDDGPPPAHISVEVDRARNSGICTIVLYVWQH